MLSNDKKKKLRNLIAKIEPSEEAKMLSRNLEEDIKALEGKISNTPDYAESIAKITKGIFALRDFVVEKFKDIPDKTALEEITKISLENVDALEKKLTTELGNIQSDVLGANSDIEGIKLQNEQEIADLKDLLNKLRLEIASHGGGSMNRQIRVAGVDVLKSYTDINLIGSGVTITAANNNITKRTDITFTGSAGGVTSVSNSDGSLTISPTTGAVVASLNLAHSNTFTATQGISLSQSNSNPGTTRFFHLDNAGTNTYIDFNFSGVLKSAYGADSSGGLAWYSSGNSFTWYTGTPSSPTTSAYLTSTVFNHVGYGTFGSGVHAGSQSTPSSSLQSAGSAAFKVTRVTSDHTLSSLETQVLADATTAASCIGSASVGCGSYTNQGDCEARDSHGGCVWGTTSCSIYNGEYGMGTCISQAGAGCSAETTSCSGAGDAGSCTAQNDSYGGSCSWVTCSSYDSDYGGCVSAGCTPNTSDCSVFAEGDCAAHVSLGCVENFTGNTCPSFTNTSDCNTASPCSATLGGDCGTLSDGGGDGTLCATQPECSYDSGTGSCTGSYFTSCGGDNSVFASCSGNFITSCSGDHCIGTFYDGVCNGTFGTCTGSPTCGGINDSTNCNSETGCAWTTVLNLTLPSIASVPDRTYWIENDTPGGADVVINRNGTDLVDGASTLTLRNYKDAVHLAPYTTIGDCSVISEGSCSGYSGCTANYSGCTWNMGDSTCTGVTGCSAYDGNESGCTTASIYTGCSGTYVAERNWYIFGDVRPTTNQFPVLEKNTSYTLTPEDYTVWFSSNTCTATLPTATLFPGKIYEIKNNGTGVITINTTSSQTIDGISSATITLKQWEFLRVQSNSGNWIIVESNLHIHPSSITLAAGTATAGTAPLYFQGGTNLSSIVSGAMEWNGSGNPTFGLGSIRYAFGFLEENGQIWSGTQIFKNVSSSAFAARFQTNTSQSVNLLNFEIPGGTAVGGIDSTASGLFLGLAGTQIGTIKLSGNTSGTITITPAAAAGTWTFTLPITGGTNNYALTTNGSGVSTWAQISLTAGVTGTLPIANGGTGATTLLGAGLSTVTNVALTAQTADIGATNLATVAGRYLVSYSLQDTTADLAAGAVILTLSYTDGAGATTNTATQLLTAVGRQSGSVYIQLASGNLTYAITHTGAFGTAAYALYISTERYV